MCLDEKASLTAIAGGGEPLRKKYEKTLASGILHMLMDTFPALYQRGVVHLWTVEIWAALWTAVIGFIAVKLYRIMNE